MNSVRLIVDVRIKPGSEDELRSAYAALVERAQEQPGLIGHQLCQAIDDDDRWLVVSEWDSLDASDAWDRSEEHARLLAPLRACFAQAQRTRLHIRDGARR
jgi:heme oxygenase (mycobilin-producing)